MTDTTTTTDTTTAATVPLVSLTADQLTALQAYIAQAAATVQVAATVSCQTVETYSD